MKIVAESVKLQFDNIPALFEESTIETIWSGRFVIRHMFDNVIDFLHSERQFQDRKINTSDRANNSIDVKLTIRILSNTNYVLI